MQESFANLMGFKVFKLQHHLWVYEWGVEWPSLSLVLPCDDERHRITGSGPHWTIYGFSLHDPLFQKTQALVHCSLSQKISLSDAGPSSWFPLLCKLSVHCVPLITSSYFCGDKLLLGGSAGSLLCSTYVIIPKKECVICLSFKLN